MDSVNKPCLFCGAEMLPPDWEYGDTLYYLEHEESCFMHKRCNGGPNTVLAECELEAWNARETEEDVYLSGYTDGTMEAL